MIHDTYAQNQTPSGAVCRNMSKAVRDELRIAGMPICMYPYMHVLMRVYLVRHFLIHACVPNEVCLHGHKHTRPTGAVCRKMSKAVRWNEMRIDMCLFVCLYVCTLACLPNETYLMHGHTQNTHRSCLQENVEGCAPV